MGLDMYLNKRTYVKQWDHIDPKEQYEVTVTRGGKPVPAIQTKRVKAVVEEVAYWRKANHIHQWFVCNIQDGEDNCSEYEVSKSELKKLVDLCKLILVDPGKASVLLPTQEGFFYGSTDYDESYFDDLQETIDMLEPLLDEPGDGWFLYQSSW